MRLGIVVSEFNFDITMMMLEQAKAHAAFLGVEVAEVVVVPGVFDMPLAIQTLLKRTDIDGVVCLGAVIQGDTNHDEVVISHAARKMADLSLLYEKPVGLGVTGPGMTRLQAMDRIDRAKAAVEAAVKLYRAVKKASGRKHPEGEEEDISYSLRQNPTFPAQEYQTEMTDQKAAQGSSSDRKKRKK